MLPRWTCGRHAGVRPLNADFKQLGFEALWLGCHEHAVYSWLRPATGLRAPLETHALIARAALAAPFSGPKAAAIATARRR